MGRLRAAQEKHSVVTLRGEKKAMTFAEHPFGGFLFPSVLLRTIENLLRLCTNGLECCNHERLFCCTEFICDGREIGYTKR